MIEAAFAITGQSSVSQRTTTNSLRCVAMEETGVRGPLVVSVESANKGKSLAEVSEERRWELEQVGRERSLVYKAYLLTGLRKSELASRRLCIGNQ